MAVAPQALHQGVAVEARQGRLARRIDLGHDHHIGVVETGAEVAEQVGQARIAVWLDDGDHPALGYRARGLQHRGDLHRMVAIVVDDPHPVGDAGGREAAPHPAETGQALADILRAHRQLTRHGDGGQRVHRIVVAGHGQVQIDVAHRLGVMGMDHHVEPATVRAHGQVLGADLGLRIDAVGDEPAVLHAAGHRLDVGMVGADRGEAIERDVLHEILEALLHRVEVAPVVQVLGVDVGDDGHGGFQLQERAVALVGLDHDPVTGPNLRVGAIGVDDPAVDHGRVQPAGVQQGRHHRGRGSLAVRAADGD